MERHVHDVSEPTQLPNGDFTYDCQACVERERELTVLKAQYASAFQEGLKRGRDNRDRKREAMKRERDAAREVVEAARKHYHSDAVLLAAIAHYDEMKGGET